MSAIKLEWMRLDEYFGSLLNVSFNRYVDVYTPATRAPCAGCGRVLKRGQFATRHKRLKSAPALSRGETFRLRAGFYCMVCWPVWVYRFTDRPQV